MRSTKPMALVAVVVFASGCFGGNDPDRAPEDAAYKATIRWTSHGIPHILADNWAGLGYGHGYASATLVLCTMAEEFVTARGERSLFFGPDGPPAAGYLGSYAVTNEQSDAFVRLFAENPEMWRPAWANAPPASLDAMRGFAAGYNRFLAGATPAEIGPCAGEPWLRPISVEDVQRRLIKLQLFASAWQFMAGMFEARPPTAGVPPPLPVAEFDLERDLGFGSNAHAYGKDATADGRGMLLANPHFPWAGSERFLQFHLTIPGEADVMGASLLALPYIAVGMTDEFAWSHTVSPAWRFGIYELTLVPGDPTSYVYDGQARKMTTKDVTYQVAGPDGPVNRTHRYHFSHFGPMFTVTLVQRGAAGTGLAWTTAKAYTFRDANAMNDRLIEQFYRFNTAQTFDEFKGALIEVLGVPWVHTTAASRDGNAFYGDVSVVPFVTHEQIPTCNTALGRVVAEASAPTRLYILDGSTARCEWKADPSAPQSGIIPASGLPKSEQSTYLFNANDNHWLPNSKVRLEGFPPMMGDEQSRRSFRTRVQYELIDARLSGTAPCTIEPGVACDKMTLARLQDLLFNHTLLTPRLVIPDVLSSTCVVPTVITQEGQTVDITQACAVLRAWDKTAGLDAKGLALFDRFWNNMPPTNQVWSVPFDAKDPVNTPRGFVGTNPLVREALADAVTELKNANIPLDAPTRDWQFVVRGDEKIPLHGANGIHGAANVLYMPFMAGKGYQEVDDLTGRALHATSHVATITWDDKGPVADALLTYSQSTNPSNPYAADQTRLYSMKQWNRLPFTQAQIEADPEFRSESIWE